MQSKTPPSNYFPFTLCCTSYAHSTYLISHLPFGKCNRRTNVLAPPSCGPTPRVILCVPLPFLVRLLCGLLPLFLLGRGPPVVQEGGGGGLCCTRKGPIVQYRNRRGTLQIEILLKYFYYLLLQTNLGKCCAAVVGDFRSFPASVRVLRSWPHSYCRAFLPHNVQQGNDDEGKRRRRRERERGNG